MSNEIKVITDTATLCIYDLEALKHRLEDTPDWWSIPEDELAEVNRGNVAFLNVGSDGLYHIERVPIIKRPDVQMMLNVPSGRVYAGAAEDVTGDELEPEDLDNGQYITVEPGVYTLAVGRKEQKIEFALIRSKVDHVKNYFDDLIRIG